MKIIKIISIAIFFLVVLIPVIFMNRESDTISEVDNRRLQEFPIGANYGGNFTGEVTDYFSDRAWGRDSAINLYSDAYYNLFGELKHPSYSFGKDGYVFFQPTNYQDQAEFAEVFANYLKKLQDYCNERGVPFLYCLNPSKSTVYEEYLPNGYNYKRDWVDYFIARLEELGVNYIDNTEMLIEKHYDEQIYNKQYDAGHWNDLGAFYASNEILSAISRDFPSVSQNTLDDFNILTEVAEYLPTSQFKVNEEYPYFELKNDTAVWTTDYNDEIYLNPAYHDFSYFVNTDDNASILPKLLMFQGSYFNSRHKFLSNNFREFITVHNYYNLQYFDYYFNIFQPECVVVTTAEYTTNGAYFSQDYMDSAIYQPSYNLLEDYSNVLREDAIELEYSKEDMLTTVYSYVDISLYDYAYLISKNKVYDMAIDKYSGIISLTLNNDDIDTENIDIILVNSNNKIKNNFGALIKVD